MGIEQIIIAFISILAITGLIGLINKTVAPFKAIKYISAGIGLISFLVFLISNSRLTFVLLIIVFLIGISLIRLLLSSNMIPDFMPHSPVERRNKDSGNIGGIGLLIVIGGVMYFVFSEYLDFKIQSETKSSIAEIALIMTIFCFLMCITSWTITRIFGGNGSYTTLGIIPQSSSNSNQHNVELEDIRVMISKGNLTEALSELELFANHKNIPDFDKTILLIKMNIKEMNKKYNMGLISFEENQIEKTRFSEKLLSLIDEMKEGWH